MIDLSKGGNTEKDAATVDFCGGRIYDCDHNDCINISRNDYGQDPNHAERSALMKVSKSQASDNRDAILTAASTQIRARGLDQSSVADVARAAGLTHGALYSHFQSKDRLTAEAMTCAFADCLREFSGLPAPEFLQRYLSTQHRDHPEAGCPTAALVSEVARQPTELKTAFRSGVDRFIALAAKSLEAVGAEHGRERAVLMFAAMVGGLALSRAIRDVDASGSVDILRAVNNQLGLLVDC
jgi:TetR/AcrR family transcriptional repressor of nem operon